MADHPWARYKVGHLVPPMAYLPPSSQMTPVTDTSTAATTQHSSKNPKQQFNHPLDPLTADEVLILRHYLSPLWHCLTLLRSRLLQLLSHYDTM